MRDTFRIGFIGAGGICRDRHLPNLKRIEGVELKAVCNRSLASSRQIATAFGFETIEEDWRRLIERKDIEIVFIGSYPNTHAEMSIAALEAGKHVFCQARMSATLAEAQAMLAASERYPQQVTAICPSPHRMPWEAAIRDAIASGRLGTITHVEVQALNAVNTAPQLHWRERSEINGIQIMQVGIFAETLNAWLGPYERLSAQGRVVIPFKHDAQGNTVKIEIPQVVTIQGQLESGALVTETHSGVCDHEQISLICIYGTEASLRVLPGREIFIADSSKGFEPWQVPEALLRGWQVELDFINAVIAQRAGRIWQQDPDFRSGLAYMRKMQAVAEAMRTKAHVALAQI